MKDSGEATSNPIALREFVWKGQMSYMTAIHMVVLRFFKSAKPRPQEITGSAFNTGPAHYSAEETATWWKMVRDYWTVTPVTQFPDTTLSNGKSAGKIDTNDLVAVAEFQTEEPAAPFFYSSGAQKNADFLSIASKTGDVLGFKLAWPFKPDDRHYKAKDLFYGVDRWDMETKNWVELVDITMISSASKMVNGKNGEETQLVEVRYAAPQPGTYRFRLGYGGSLSHLGSLGFDPETGESPALTIDSQGFTFNQTQAGHNQGPAWFYIPKGVKSVDFEVWGAGVPSTGCRVPFQKVFTNGILP